MNMETSSALVAYYESLEAEKRNALECLLPVFLYITSVPELPIRREVDLGEPLGVYEVVAPDKEKAEEIITYLRENQNELISERADRYFKETFVRPSTPCILPERDLAMEKSATLPAFGLLVAVHDMDCPRCDLDGPDAEKFDEPREATAAAMPLEIQRHVISWARAILPVLLDRTGYPIADMGDEIKSFPEWLKALSHPRGHCVLADTVSQPVMRWMATHPLHFSDCHCHAMYCTQFGATMKAFERVNVSQLIVDDRQLYHQLARKLTGTRAYIYP